MFRARDQATYIPFLMTASYVSTISLSSLLPGNRPEANGGMSVFSLRLPFVLGTGATLCENSYF